MKAKELYNVYCGVCHGAKGAGQGILVKREKILADIGRVRNIIEGPDGYLYISVENKGIIKIIPSNTSN